MGEDKRNHCDVGDYVRIRAVQDMTMLDEGLVIDVESDSGDDPGVVSILCTPTGQIVLYDLAEPWVVLEKIFDGPACKS